MLRIGLDVGSTTLKCVVLDDSDNIIYSSYGRHFSRITECAAELWRTLRDRFPDAGEVSLCISGSAGMGFADQMGIPFIQEVYATRVAMKKLHPEVDVVIELGGEDAKILFLSGTMEVRMNGSCAGGTGAFIDQMATLLGVRTEDMNELAAHHGKIYRIASRCGVFAKSDIQPLLNQGATKEDIAASIFTAVVNQTVAGLAQGREISGKIAYLGGPLTFMPELRAAFDHALACAGLCPENSLYYVSLGAAYIDGDSRITFDELIDKISAYSASGTYSSCLPLFTSEEEYRIFARRHDKTMPPDAPLGDSAGAYIGIDAGSTTVKAVVMNESEEVVYHEYMPNSGNPVPMVKKFLENVYEKFPEIRVLGTAVTGYGEEIIKNAFHADIGVVETIAHFTAAKKYDPDVDFIIDIGGQDIKCFKIRAGAIDNIFLNEACSSGCGSFLQTFAGALGYTPEEFASCALRADRPVDLGSRCTVFMNSSVKQAQKDGASIENISAGLAISVVKNALYKVIRMHENSLPGEHIVVQGGTFLSDAVLRAFENEIGCEVTRPPYAGIMGAYGAALYAKAKGLHGSGLLDAGGLRSFTHSVTATTCNGCTNRCRLTINTFDGGRRFIGGNQCEKPLKIGTNNEHKNLYEFKRSLLASYSSCDGENGEIIGIPMGLNMYELLPFWHRFFTSLGFGIRLSPPSSKKLYLLGQTSIPSDTVCYPAKLIHGHIQSLINDGVRKIFYPCMSYNLDEHLGDNHYNCPVVAYYPEVIGGNVKGLSSVRYIYDYVGPHKRREFPGKMCRILDREFGEGRFTKRQVKAAADAAYAEYGAYMARVREEGEKYFAYAQEKKLPVIVVAGRPYHLDPEINHGIDKLICQCGAVLITEDSLGDRYGYVPTDVLNQWTYHSRMYAAANFVAGESELVNLVQLVSFGCGLDAITSDEVRRILESKNKIYTQIKIDEITNLGAVKIRLRSLFAALGL